MREDGVQVFGTGEAKAPVSLRNVCNRFILISNIVGGTKDVVSAENKPSTSSAADKQPPSRVVPMVIKAMNAIDPDGDCYPLGLLGQHITRANTDLDSRTYGSAKLSDLLTKTGRFEVHRYQDTQLRLRRLV